MVAVTKTGERLVGQMAKRQAVVNPENTLFHQAADWRRWTDPDVQHEMQLLPYKIARPARA